MRPCLWRKCHTGWSTPAFTCTFTYVCPYTCKRGINTCAHSHTHTYMEKKEYSSQDSMPCLYLSDIRIPQRRSLGTMTLKIFSSWRSALSFIASGSPMTWNSWLLRLAFVAKQIHLKKKKICALLGPQSQSTCRWLLWRMITKRYDHVYTWSANQTKLGV